MAQLHLLLHVLALCLFLLASWPMPSRVNLIAAGLAALTLTLIV